ncbi:MAG: DegT/DnrJ/EryC1/StrS family aminotransferase, partial [Saprospiraceae bacterium]|nr:DegT/DnrJ/EryC1/StrS family aminotransferase [Saprospiraceae bacterium]
MVELKSLHQRFRKEMDSAISKCIDNSDFVGGKNVQQFEANLSKYLNVNHVISCGNGTDAIQIALMSLNLS